MSEGNGSNGCIDLILYHSAQEEGRTRGDLTVLSPQRDPYRWDRQNTRKAGSWFKKQMDRFLPEGTIHLRGLHYRITAAADVVMPDGNRTASRLHPGRPELAEWKPWAIPRHRFVDPARCRVPTGRRAQRRLGLAMAKGPKLTHNAKPNAESFLIDTGFGEVSIWGVAQDL